MSACLASRPAWSGVAGSTFLSRQEWQYSFLVTLCEALAAAEGVPVSECSVAGVWDKVTGDGYVSDQQFYATSLSTLCLLKDAISGGGGGGGLKFTPGTGSPEGVVSGSPGDTYWDTDGGFYYVKVTGSETTTGWLIH